VSGDRVTYHCRVYGQVTCLSPIAPTETWFGECCTACIGLIFPAATPFLSLSSNSNGALIASNDGAALFTSSDYLNGLEAQERKQLDNFIQTRPFMAANDRLSIPAVCRPVLHLVKDETDYQTCLI
jgi:hypothetical protein